MQLPPPKKKYIPLLRKEQGFGIIDALNLSDAQSVFYGFLQAAWLGSRMARKRGFAINSIEREEKDMKKNVIRVAVAALMVCAAGTTRAVTTHRMADTDISYSGGFIL